jgi:hypothetical protein
MEGQTEREPRYALSDGPHNRRRFRASPLPATATYPLMYPSRMRLPMTRMRVPMTRMSVPMTRMRAPMTRMRAPMTRMRVPMTQMRVPMTRMRVQEMHGFIDLRDALGSRRDGMLATGPAHSLRASCLSSPQLRLDTDRPAVGAVGALTARRARCNAAGRALPAGRQPHPQCPRRAPLRLPACPLHCPPACSTTRLPLAVLATPHARGPHCLGIDALSAGRHSSPTRSTPSPPPLTAFSADPQHFPPACRSLFLPAGGHLNSLRARRTSCRPEALRRAPLILQQDRSFPC